MSLIHAVILGVAFSRTIGFLTVVEVVQGKTTLASLIASAQARHFLAIFSVLYLLGLYISCAVAAKRLHDRNKSAWWLVVFYGLPLALQIPLLIYVPVQMAHLVDVLHAAQAHVEAPLPLIEPPLVTLTRGASTLVSLWAFIEPFCLSGTPGGNRFGPDPLAVGT